MPKLTWPRRFSLRGLLIACVISGTATGWLAKNYHEYLVEQRWLADFLQNSERATVLTSAKSSGPYSSHFMDVM